MKFLSDEQLKTLLPAETSSFPSPVPTQIVSSDEYLPVPQSAKQREVEARLKEMSGALAKHQGMSRRRFFQTASGMAASFVALNQVFGPLFDVSLAEAATPELADQLAAAMSGQMVIDGHTHFLRDDTRLMNFVKGREAVGKSGKEPMLTVEHLSTERFAGGILAGFAGALLALPIAATIKVIAVDVILASRSSPPPEDPSTDCPAAPGST
jgi:hypothetical protein